MRRHVWGKYGLRIRLEGGFFLVETCIQANFRWATVVCLMLKVLDLVDLNAT